jgi:hypothetical protein
MSTSSSQDSDEYTAEDIISERTKQVKYEIHAALKRVALVLTINDKGLNGYVDAACKIDRRAIMIEELKNLIAELENTDEDFIQKNWGGILAQARNEESSWVGFDGGERLDLNALRADLDSAAVPSSDPSGDLPPSAT